MFIVTDIEAIKNDYMRLHTVVMQDGFCILSFGKIGEGRIEDREKIVAHAPFTYIKKYSAFLPDTDLYNTSPFHLGDSMDSVIESLAAMQITWTSWLDI